jgi:branched-chain amino acid transport system ATP-binding protein
MAETLLEIEDIVAGYGYGDILRGSTLNVTRGCTTCIIGPNGAGKSTLLKVVSGLLKPRRGSIRFGGEEIAGRTPKGILRRGVVQVPQDRSLFPSMNVWQNVLMGGYILSNRAAVQERIERVAEQFPIVKEMRHAKAGSLSGGQQRIVEFARAMMLDPALILLDEPSLGLDPKSRKLVFDTALSLCDGGRSVLMVEQNAKSGLAVSEYGAVMELGVVRLTGKASDLLADPEVGRLYLGASAAHHRRPAHVEHVRT